MKHTSCLIILFFIYQTGQAQNKTLSERLWAQVHSCYSLFDDMDGDGKIDYDEIIDDSKKGYLKVSGSFPTCGCTCENTVGAYKTNSKEYIFIKTYSWGCSWKKGISSNESLTQLFPFDFEVDGFFETRIDNPNQTATFYLDFEIPRQGTDTKVMIKPIPFGLKMRSAKNIEFSYTEENRFDYSDKLFQIRDLIARIKSPQTIACLLDNDLANITEEDKELIEKTIGTRSDQFKTKEALVKVMQELKHTYNIYTQIKYEYLVLGWNRDSGTFYIKEKVKRERIDSFMEFLKKIQIWSALC